LAHELEAGGTRRKSDRLDDHGRVGRKRLATRIAQVHSSDDQVCRSTERVEKGGEIGDRKRRTLNAYTTRAQKVACPRHVPPQVLLHRSDACTAVDAQVTRAVHRCQTLCEQRMHTAVELLQLIRE
jgi:hypothetical protein